MILNSLIRNGLSLLDAVQSFRLNCNALNLLIKCGVIALLSGCVLNNVPFSPNIIYYPSERILEGMPSPFPPLTLIELEEEWGKELFFGLHFAKEFDFYRAITCYKRALFASPPEKIFEIEYHLIEAYYLGRKYDQVIEIYESGTLGEIALEAPGVHELLLMLYDSYLALDQNIKACRIQALIQSLEPSIEENLQMYTAIESANFCALESLQITDPDLRSFLADYQTLKKSVRMAQSFNALLPGAGYYYVGQSKTAVTAFIVNALFTYAAYQFFDRGYIAAGLITSSLEIGWYLGGINGAGLAAQEINESTYSTLGKDFLIKKRLFPILMFDYVF